jgi:hypothetical protein
MQENTSGIGLNLQLLGYLSVAHFTEVPQAERFRLPRRQFSDCPAQSLSEFTSLGVTCWFTIGVAGGPWVPLHGLTTFLSSFLTQPVDGARRGHVLEEARHIPYALAAGDLERGQERFLKTVGRIAMINKQAVGRLPDHRPMFFHNCLPVMYLQVTLRFAVLFVDQTGPAGVSNETTSDRVSIII